MPLVGPKRDPSTFGWEISPLVPTAAARLPNACIDFKWSISHLHGNVISPLRDCRQLFSPGKMLPMEDGTTLSPKRDNAETSQLWTI